MAETETHAETAGFSPLESEEVPYQPVSRFAVIAMILALLSATAMIDPLLWIFPIVSVAMAAAALLRIAHRPELAGRRLAVIAVFLAVLFGTWGASWIVSRQTVLNQQARQHAEQWFDLFRQNRKYEAHQLCKFFYERVPPGTVLEEHYAPQKDDANVMSMAPTPSADFDTFVKAEPVKSIVDLGGEFDVRFGRNLAIKRDGAWLLVVEQTFFIVPRQDPQRQLHVKIRMQRAIEDGRAFWQVDRLEEVKAS